MYNLNKFLSRDGGTGRRSGLKIRRASALGGSTPPPGTKPKYRRHKSNPTSAHGFFSPLDNPRVSPDISIKRRPRRIFECLHYPEVRTRPVAYSCDAILR